MSHSSSKHILALVAALVCVAASTAHAYIPSSRTIAIRTAKNNGKGAYAIEQDVQFRAGSDSVTLRESWVVQDGDDMKVTVTGPNNTRFETVYRAGKKTGPDSSGAVKTAAIPSEFIERFTHARTSNELLQSFVKAGVVPPSFLQERPRFNPNAKNPHSAEPLVRLGRSNGVLTWIFGTPTPVDSSKLLPAAWIEQDAFSLRRLRFPSEAELNANQYVVQAGNFVYPKERIVTWGGNTVAIRMLSVKALPAGAAQSALNASDSKATRLPDQANVREFYSRFR